MAPIKTPAIVLGFTAHSFGVGPAHDVAVLDDDPLFLSPAAGPLANSFIWNHTAGAFEVFQLETGSGNVNANTHPDWNQNDADKISMAQMLLAAARQKWPNEDIYLVPLGRFSATMGPGSLSLAVNNRDVFSVDNTTVPTETQIVFTGGLGAIDRAGPVKVALAGLTGLTPDINGTHDPVTVQLSGNQITVPTATTGTAGFGSATVNFMPGTWDPAETGSDSVFVDWDLQLSAAYEALWAADLAPDPRGLFVCIGINDVSFGISSGFEAAMLRFVAAQRTLMNVRSDEDVPIVWLEPIVALGTSAANAETIRGLQTALRTAARTDPKMATINVDSVPTPLDGPVAMTDDSIHPTYRGFMSLGKALFGGLNATSTG